MKNRLFLSRISFFLRQMPEHFLTNAFHPVLRIQFICCTYCIIFVNLQKIFCTTCACSADSLFLANLRFFCTLSSGSASNCWHNSKKCLNLFRTFFQLYSHFPSVYKVFYSLLTNSLGCYSYVALWLVLDKKQFGLPKRGVGIEDEKLLFEGSHKALTFAREWQLRVPCHLIT